MGSYGVANHAVNISNMLHPCTLSANHSSWMVSNKALWTGGWVVATLCQRAFLSPIARDLLGEIAWAWKQVKTWMYLTNCVHDHCMNMRQIEERWSWLTVITAINVITHHLGIMIIPAHITDWQKCSIRANIHSPTNGSRSLFIIICEGRVL